MSPISSTPKNYSGTMSPNMIQGASTRSGANLLREMNNIVHQIMLTSGRMNKKSNNNISVASDPDNIASKQKGLVEEYLADCLIINKQEKHVMAQKDMKEVLNSYNTLTASDIENAKIEHKDHGN